MFSFGKGCFRWRLRKLDAFFFPLSCIASQMSQARYFSRFLLVAISKLLNYSTSLPLMGAVSEKHWWPTLHWVFRQIFGADNSWNRLRGRGFEESHHVRVFQLVGSKLRQSFLNKMILPTNGNYCPSLRWKWHCEMTVAFLPELRRNRSLKPVLCSRDSLGGGVTFPGSHKSSILFPGKQNYLYNLKCCL